MPPRPPNRNVSSPLRPAPNAPYHPPTDTATYRDLLLFEERLKSNAEMLKRRRRRYMIFLWSFVAVLGCMGHKLVIHPPDNTLLLRALQASVAVVSITLVLFFASGMYEEKIRYAHSYINHSNRSLRPLNMHLNMRRPLPFPFSLPFFPSALRPSSTNPARRPSTTASPTSFKPSLPGKNLPSTLSPNATTKSRRPSVTPNVMATIPPSSNPRGELIFSSRVDRSFREGYERYRSAFERRREEKQRAARADRGWFWFLYGDTGLAGGGGGGRGVSPSASVGSVSSGWSKRRSETPSPCGTTRTLTPVHGSEHRRRSSPSSLGIELGLKAE
ncbi:hypothetical protein L202_03927 [Cryptococcus amylolentus CBS 6039]|uniref:Transmembrane protein 188 n=1 Tax=Cryptococcus amylolentus CBS 6039 TaxID=1295533 RepID=A0A1E3HPJ5_9TREE|nr:hypothetical protein L202_03927 [Cryptococcus amylolentus CBS 6039]ODN78280.1 hypothetical protein L202_03927 [Cryptococcus amylolentus CBS 6039]